jgi:hypothetical protein
VIVSLGVLHPKFEPLLHELEREECKEQSSRISRHISFQTPYSVLIDVWMKACVLAVELLHLLPVLRCEVLVANFGLVYKLIVRAARALGRLGFVPVRSFTVDI